MLEKLLDWDREIFIFLNNLGTDSHDVFWQTITKFPPWIPLYLILIALLFWKSSFKEGVWMLLSYVSMLVILQPTIYTTKHFVGRLRPNNNESINQLIRIVHEPSNFSFFSGHAAFSFSIATLAVLFLRKKTRFIHFVWLYPILFSSSRIYLGVHYPSDILVGALVGVLFAFVFYRMHQKFKAPYIP
ncbi:phosphatase PAP2 family protein [Aurantibacter crassamenti]|uniref:phosphatase PAP2 family protein n=1 Tax=Aurantibacter crassamenti TaxID=1837375 RepID=UPI00193946AE|nr:phosphatase PAP2 family protein [Aurantibacter crassamenti]MBM1108050.1 phosphatase PAP2 family protein [Aurantibacter crassamenti]